ncbi:MAG: hypothetical protein V3T41_00975 [bacterium]
MKKLLPILVLASLLAATACDEMYDPPPGPPPPRWPDLTSPANVLRTVEASFNSRDIDLLRKSISPNFVFYFDPRDVGRTPPANKNLIPESWPNEWFWNAAHNMFNKAYSINLSINTNRVGEPEPEEKTYPADNIDLALLVMVDELNGYVADGYCNFEFESYPTKEGKKNWRLTNWWDRTSELNGKPNGLTPSSLGRILAMYR